MRSKPSEMVEEMAQLLDSLSFMDIHEDGILTCYECRWCDGASVGPVGNWTVAEARESVVHRPNCRLREFLRKIGVAS